MSCWDSRDCLAVGGNIRVASPPRSKKRTALGAHRKRCHGSASSATLNSVSCLSANWCMAVGEGLIGSATSGGGGNFVGENAVAAIWQDGIWSTVAPLHCSLGRNRSFLSFQGVSCWDARVLQLHSGGRRRCHGWLRPRYLLPMVSLVGPHEWHPLE